MILQLLLDRLHPYKGSQLIWNKNITISTPAADLTIQIHINHTFSISMSNTNTSTATIIIPTSITVAIYLAIGKRRGSLNHRAEC